MGRVLEEARGVGDLYEGETRLGEATYRITVYQETQSVGSFGASGSQEIDLMKRISGDIDPAPPLDRFQIVGKVLTLHLENGRRWDFVIANHTAQNAGQKGLYKP